MRTILDTQFSIRSRRLLIALFIQFGVLSLLSIIFGGVGIYLGIETIEFSPILDQNKYRPYSDIAAIGLFATFLCTMIAYAIVVSAVRCPECKRRTLKRVPYDGNVAFICKRCGVRIKTRSKYYELN